MPTITPQELARRNPLLALYEMGMSIEDVKTFIHATLGPFFENVATLESVDTGILAVEAIQVGACIVDRESEHLLHIVTGHIRHGVQVNRELALNTCAGWENDMAKASSEHWSLGHLELLKADLPLEEFRVEIFRNIGGLIEACVKPALGHLLSFIRIAKDKPASAEVVAELSLGQIVAEVRSSFGDPGLVAPPPWHIGLNQWRNIAQHHATEVRDGVIVGHYREGKQKLEIRLSRDDATAVAMRVVAILRLLNAARRLFMLEHGAELSPRIQWPEPRHETNVLNLSAAVSTQGFVVEDVVLTKQEVLVTLRDVTSLPWQGRAVHCSQFVLLTWRFFSKRIVVLRLNSKDGSSVTKITADERDIARVADGTEPFENLANYVRFTRG